MKWLKLLTARTASENAGGTPNFLRTPSLAQQQIDWVVLWVPVLLMFWGLIMVYSASIALPDSSRYKNYGHASFALKHGFGILVGLGVGVFAFRVPSMTWEKLAPLMFVGTLFLLVIVLIVGRDVGGGRRWLPLGVMNLQPSELMKIASALYAASYCVRKQRDILDFGKGVVPMMVVILIVGALLMLEPDLGAFMVVASITMGVIFLGGVNWKVFAGMVGSLLLAFAAMVLFVPWRAKRFFAYLDPFEKANAEHSGYQLTQSLIAFGRGELFGVGLGDSVQKMYYLPEAHTDFILAVIGEEFGLIGVWTVIIAFTILVRRLFSIAREAMVFDRIFQALAVQGIAIWFGAQGFINMGVNMGVLPTKGLTLPFISYGGSGILVNCLAIAFVLRVDYENRQIMRGEKE